LVSRGYGSTEVLKAFQTADRFNRRLGNLEQQFYSGWGIGAFKYITGDLTGALEVLRDLERLATELGNDDLRGIAIVSTGIVLFALGRFDETLEQTERGLAEYDPERSRAYLTRLGQDVFLLGMAYGGVAAWSLGKPDMAREMTSRALELARRGGDNYTLALVLSTGVPLVRFRSGEVEQTEAGLDEAIDIARENQFPYTLARATAMLGLVKTRTRRVEEGLADIREGIASLRAIGGRTTLPMMLVWLADGSLSANDPKSARTALHDALEIVAETGEHSHLSEIHRLLGRAELADNAPEAALAYFREAYELAEAQGALGWRLRASLDLAASIERSGR
ncbi:MAG TPA: tetratricopeptide repeat protein, partial [Gammaproteobacteria bacterium]|nr:tetratricopeptide repeat protein [Gammaproteobacteria bacterium]